MGNANIQKQMVSRENLELSAETNLEAKIAMKDVFVVTVQDMFDQLVSKHGLWKVYI